MPVRYKVRLPRYLAFAQQHPAQRPSSSIPGNSLSPNVNSLDTVPRLLIFSLLLFINLLKEFSRNYENVKCKI